MLEFRFHRTKQTWVVVGSPDEMRIGEVQVQRKNGEVKTETIVQLLPVFDTPEGPRQYGLIRSLSRGPRHRPEPRYSFPVEVRRVDE